MNTTIRTQPVTAEQALAAYPKLVDKIRDIHHFLKNGTPLYSHALCFEEELPAVEVLGNLLRELGEKEAE